MNQLARALNLPPEVIRRMRVFEDALLARLVIHNELSMVVAQELLRAKDLQQRALLAERAVKEHWKRADARQALRRVPPTPGQSGRGTAAADHARSVAVLARKLDRRLEATSLDELPPAARRELEVLHRRLTLLIVDDIRATTETGRGGQR